MFLCIFWFFFTNVFAWNPANFSYDPGTNYELVWSDEFENVGPIQAIINGQPAYSPNPANWRHEIGMHLDGGLENYSNSIYNSYVQNGQLTIVAMKENESYISSMLSSCFRQEFTFGKFVAKIILPYGRGIWPAWWMVGQDHRYNLSWPTTGEIDILEMWGGNNKINFTDQYAHATIHWNNASATMNPLFHTHIMEQWNTPDGSMLHNNSLVYWADWTPTNITMGVNEFIYFQVNTTNMADSFNPVLAFSGMFPYCLRFDIAIASAAPGPPDQTNVWPQQMIVDWVRVYQEKRNRTE